MPLDSANYYSDSQENCAHAGTIAVTILAGPLNYVGVNPEGLLPPPAAEPVSVPGAPRKEPQMLAVIAAVIFVIAFILRLTGTATDAALLARQPAVHRADPSRLAPRGVRARLAAGRAEAPLTSFAAAASPPWPAVIPVRPAALPGPSRSVLIRP